MFFDFAGTWWFVLQISGIRADGRQNYFEHYDVLDGQPSGLDFRRHYDFLSINRHCLFLKGLNRTGAVKRMSR